MNTHTPRPKPAGFSGFFPALAIFCALAPAFATARAAAPEPGKSSVIVIKGVREWPSKNPSDKLPEAGGVETSTVLRADKEHPESSDGRGWTFHHHPDMAVWRGRLYVAWSSCVKDEDTWPNRELYSTSADGRAWSGPLEMFPEGVSVPSRMYFYRSPDDVMLMFAGTRLNREKISEKKKDGLVARRVMPDHTLGPVHILRMPEGWAGGKKPGGLPGASLELYSVSNDKEFVRACEKLLADPVVLGQQDYGLMLDREKRMPWANSSEWAIAAGYSKSQASAFGKAMSFYHRKDGAIVGIGKNRWVTVSTDEGATWSRPVRSTQLVSGTAKVWGQRTADGRYALVYNPHPKNRFPLVVVTGDDGVTFRDMRVVNPGDQPQRYEGENKNTGAQYVRGIAEWATDGSFAGEKNNLWLAYSINKEDIVVSRVPLPARAEK
ncbi:MAG: exo-alpha-sialidase [Opitutaceae bacterium]|jgi:hypothetical protein|nr:exo-alpha-sialidase [Opitutaceae bacterium]